MRVASFRVRMMLAYLGLLTAVLALVVVGVLAPGTRHAGTTVLVVLVAGGAASAAVGAWVVRSVSRPLRMLTEGAKRLEHGDWGHRVALEGRDEIGGLARAFNRMADCLADRVAELRHQAHHDSLTGLPNRTRFHDLLDEAIAVARREDTRLGVLLLDLDGFKEINDTLGHDMGDLLLRELGPKLAGAVRDADTIARVGGDEFAVLLRGVADLGDCANVAERMSRALQGAFRVAGHALDVNGSVGIALFPDDGEDGTTLLRRADLAMYAAKRSATGVAVYSTEMDRHSSRRLTLVADLREAIESEALALHYQPKLDLATGRLTDVEALLRWEDPHHGCVPPEEFVPIAEQTGFATPLTLWVLRNAFARHAHWQEAGIDLGVAVNVPASVIQDRRFPQQVADLLATSRAAPGALVLEIPESAIMADPGVAADVLARLQALGVRLSLDDFGIGRSALPCLSELPVSELKIGRSFVVKMLADRGTAVIVQSMIDLGHNLGLLVTAEGVETEAVCDALTRFGCDQAQGDYVSPPRAAPDLERWIEAAAALPAAGRVPTP